MSTAELIALLNDIHKNIDLTFKQREAIAWAIAKLT